MADLVLSSITTGSMVPLPLWLQAVGADPALSYSAQDDRWLMTALVEAGVFATGAFKVTQRAAGANLSVDIAAGKATVLGTSISRQGKYGVESTAAINTGTAGNIVVPGSGTRTHRVILRIRDKAAAGTNYDWTLEILEDTGSGAPALPASAINLALIAVPSGSASVTDAMITDNRSFAKSPRGMIGGKKYPGTAVLAQPSNLNTWSDTTMRTGLVTLVAGQRYAFDFGVMITFSTLGGGLVTPIFRIERVVGGVPSGVAVGSQINMGTTYDYSTPTYQAAIDFEPSVNETTDWALSSYLIKHSGGANTPNFGQATRSSQTYFRIRELGFATTLVTG